MKTRKSRASKPKPKPSLKPKVRSGKRAAPEQRDAGKRLAEYRRKRDFATTPEPRGGGPGAHRLFVIQKHAATRLHYDFRLEHRGVLLSWAVPKGPSLDPADKRLAVEVEDHPVEYGGFEGEIPEGEYGGGQVLLWDRGRWQPDGDVDAGLRKGHLKFELHGEKLRGGWSLIRLRSRDGRQSKPNWLLVKSADDAADPRRDITAERPESVQTGREIAEIAAGRGPRRTWRSNRSARTKRSRRSPAAPDPEDPPRSAAVPELGFELTTLVEEAPDGDEWLHEVKLDGVRLFAVLDEGEVHLITRNEKDWTARLPGIAAAVAKLPAKQLVLDGEAIVRDARGVSRFQALQRTMLEEGRPPEFVAFDLLFQDGEDLRREPLEERKERLARLLRGVPRARDAAGTTGARSRARATIQLSEHEIGDGPRRLAAACKRGFEGIVSKLRRSPYEAVRSRAWQKSKCSLRQEFVIAGFTEPSGARAGIGALVVGVYDDGTLVPAGKVGTGFDDATLKALRRRLDPLTIEQPPFGGTAPRIAGVHWVRPELVAEVSFLEWTADGSLRHPVFVGLREDKPAKEVVREKPKEPGMSRARSSANAAAAAVLGVTITHSDRLVVAKSKATKLALARYFELVAPRMLPHLEDRPLALVRCVRGAAGACFFQKHLGEEIEGIGGIDCSAEHDGSLVQPVVQTAHGLVELAQRSVVELHLWGARADDLERPDRLVFDLDPAPDVAWKRVTEAARTVAALLEEVGLETFVQSTGGKGLHVVAPIVRRHEWPVVRSFTAAVAQAIVESAPDRYLAKATKSARTGRIFVDYLRNGRGATAICPFSPRARDGAPVAVPLEWDEIDDVRPDQWNVATLPERLRSRRRDPWAGYFEARRTLNAALLRKLGVSSR